MCVLYIYCYVVTSMMQLLPWYCEHATFDDEVRTASVLCICWPVVMREVHIILPYGKFKTLPRCISFVASLCARER